MRGPLPPLLGALLLGLSGCAGPRPGPGASAAPPVPGEVRCARVPDGAIRVDGEGDEEAWKTAPVLADFRTGRNPPGPARASTRVRIAFDSDSLFLFYDCTAVRFTVAGEGRDSEVWNGEAAEVFLCPGEGAVPYYEIDVNPEGTLYDSRIHDWRYEALSRHWKEWAQAFDAPVRAQTRIARDADGKVTGWRAEMAIPFRSLGLEGAPRGNARWRFNVFRAAGLEDGALEYSAWTPTGGDFHRPLAFPRLVFPP